MAYCSGRPLAPPTDYPATSTRSLAVPSGLITMTQQPLAQIVIPAQLIKMNTKSRILLYSGKGCDVRIHH